MTDTNETILTVGIDAVVRAIVPHTDPSALDHHRAIARAMLVHVARLPQAKSQALVELAAVMGEQGVALDLYRWWTVMNDGEAP